jgi:hypothetical protein
MIKSGLFALLCVCSCCAQGKVLYTGTALPASEGWFGPLVTVPTLDPAGFVRLDTTASSAIQDGYGRLEPLLDSTPGFRLDFTAKLESETHSDTNRAGFSVIVTDQNKHGVEIGFWSDQVWAQKLGFTHDTFKTFNTTALTDYSLTIIGNTYKLSAGGTTLLSGDTVFYDADGLPFAPDVPYRTPNILFFGDDTTSAAARFDLKSVSIVSVPEPATPLSIALCVTLLLLVRRDKRARRHACAPSRGQRESNLLSCLASIFGSNVFYKWKHGVASAWEVCCSAFYSVPLRRRRRLLPSPAVSAHAR